MSREGSNHRLPRLSYPKSCTKKLNSWDMNTHDKIIRELQDTVRDEAHRNRLLWGLF